MTKTKSKEVDGYYFDGKKTKTLYKAEDGSIEHRANSNTNTLMLTVDMMTPESKLRAIDDIANRMQEIIVDLRRLGGL